MPDIETELKVFAMLSTRLKLSDRSTDGWARLTIPAVSRKQGTKL